MKKNLKIGLIVAIVKVDVVGAAERCGVVAALPASDHQRAPNVDRVPPDTSAAVNPNQPSRPFLRLFSALQSDPAAPSAAVQPTHSIASARRKAAASVDRPLDRHVDRQLDTIAGALPAKRVEVSLGEIAPVLADAITHQRGWLSDFADDTVSIDADLYEVLLAYQKMRRLNAA